MTRRYDRIMERVSVTAEMRERVLAGIDAGGFSRSASAPKRRNPAKYWISLAACLAVILCGALAIHHLTARPAPQADTPRPDNAVCVTPPFTDVGSPEELETAAGFPVETLSRPPFPVTEIRYTAYRGGMAQVVWCGKDQELTYRKAEGSEDRSGIYEDFSAVKTVSMGGREVTLKGDGDGFRLALWADDTYTYSLSSDRAMEENVWTAVLEELCRPDPF